MQRAIDLAENAMEKGYGGPFGAVVVKDGKIIGKGIILSCVRMIPLPMLKFLPSGTPVETSKLLN